MSIETMGSSCLQDFSTEFRCFFSIANREEYVKYLKEQHKDQQIISDADRICCHIFNLLNSGEIFLGDKILWNKDYKTGFVWDNKYYTKIEAVDFTNNSDVKFCWELSRFQHMITLGKAYWLTEDEKYVNEFKSEVESWIHDNPYLYSVNWTCAMEAAVRAINMIILYYFFHNMLQDKAFWKQYIELLYIHGDFIYNNLEGFENRGNNHYISDLTGLIWIGLFFKSSNIYTAMKEEANAWLSFGCDELNKEFIMETNIDGTDYESSTSYHRLIVELYLYTSIILDKNEMSFSQRIKVLLEKMCEFLMNIVKPNGKIPFIGDEDDGRIIIFSDYSSWDKRECGYIMAAAGHYFNRADFSYYGRNSAEELIWYFGKGDKADVAKAKLTSSSFDKGGFYILRNDSITAILRGGKQDPRGDGHSHNDALSIELNILGEDFIIDPGTYVYTADYKARNMFRSTEMHNTLVIEGEEQNYFIEEGSGLFKIVEHNETICDKMSQTEFTGTFYGYKDKINLKHKRTVLLGEKSIEINDDILGPLPEGRRMYYNYILSPEVEVELQENSLILSRNGVKIIFTANNHDSIDLRESWVSYGYGHKIETIAVRLSFSKDNTRVRISRI